MARKPQQPHDEFDGLFPGIRLRNRLNSVLRSEFSEPEGRNREHWVSKLILEYGFGQEQLDINVPAGGGQDAERSTVFTDIVAYRDKRRTEPLIVVETKPPRER